MKLFVLFSAVMCANTAFGNTINKSKNDSHSKEFQVIHDSKACVNDVQRLCSRTKSKDDIALLNCLQDNEVVVKSVTLECQHFLWNYKRELTTNSALSHIVRQQCQKDLDLLQECKIEKDGHMIPCLIDNKMKIQHKQCSMFLEEMSVVIFSDYHLIYKFVDRCKSDIKKFNCGRLSQPQTPESSDSGDDDTIPANTPKDIQQYLTSQANTLECLGDSFDSITKDCKHEILRLSELQSTDYHLNRALYLACRDDREIFCANVESGEGRVYACLMKNKFSDQMSKRCMEQLTKKQQMEGRDIRADYPLFSSCKKDIEKTNCGSNNGGSQESEDFRQMSTVLLCLETRERDGVRIDPHCKAELSHRRTEMMEDYKVSPEVVVACSDDAKQHCLGKDNEPGEAVYCLMKLAGPSDGHSKGLISETCRVALIHLLKTANPTDDVLRLDPAMTRACGSVVTELCGEATAADQAFQCLLQHFESPQMTAMCKDKLTSMLYLIRQDFTIDSRLNRVCRQDAVRLCPTRVTQTGQANEVDKILEYHCMYEHYRDEKILSDVHGTKNLNASGQLLSPECSEAMFTLIKAQAVKVELDPIVFESCIDDISTLCGSDINKGKEHECLQEKIKMLKQKCRAAVIEFSKLEDADNRLNKIMRDACKPMISRFCKSAPLEQAMQCLIKHKYKDEMMDECRLAIEHMQIISLEEYQIDHRFAEFCKQEIEEYCQDELHSKGNGDTDDDRNNKVITKVAIVSCLSTKMLEGTFGDIKLNFSHNCRTQFSFELLQRSNTLRLDPILKKECQSDITKFCSGKTAEEVSTCLREHQDALSNKCHERIFKRERLEALDANFDGKLKRVCSQMIEEHCSDIPGHKLFQCLHMKMESDGFDEDCRQVLMLRLQRRMNDIRLNPGLVKDCSEDIKKFCGIQDLKSMKPQSGIELEGTIILCLKKRYSNDSRSMQAQCRQRILQIIIEGHIYMQLDPVLRRQCADDIKTLCKEHLNYRHGRNRGTVQNCLKHTFLTNPKNLSPRCGYEVRRLLRESKADIHIDQELFEVCQSSLIRLCQDIEYGSGSKMSCLLSFAEDKKSAIQLEPKCLKMLTERRELWSLSATYDLQSINDVAGAIAHSSVRTYLISMMALMVVALILLGICCGRITKRVPVDLKNK